MSQWDEALGWSRSLSEKKETPPSYQRDRAEELLAALHVAAETGGLGPDAVGRWVAARDWSQARRLLTGLDDPVVFLDDVLASEPHTVLSRVWETADELVSD